LLKNVNFDLQLQILQKVYQKKIGAYTAIFESVFKAKDLPNNVSIRHDKQNELEKVVRSHDAE